MLEGEAGNPEKKEAERQLWEKKQHTVRGEREEKKTLVVCVVTC